MIYLTSFFKSQELPDAVERFSAAVYQPKGYQYPKAEWTDIRDANGEWIRPRNFIGIGFPPASYRESLHALYRTRVQAARGWLDSLSDRSAALCCWCPYDKAAQRQLKEWGSFICHTAVLGEFLSDTLGVPVWYDSDRLNLTIMKQGYLNVVG